MSPPILTLREISLTFGQYPILENINLTVSEGERLCLVGRNGCGKSTLLEVASGLLEMDSGERFVKPGITYRYLRQEPDLSGFETCLSFVQAGLAPGDNAHIANYLLEQLGLQVNENPANLSVGQARQCALAQVLAPEPDILFLDEPTNHLDLNKIRWLESYLSGLNSVLVLISHDRKFLENLTQATLWIDRGRLRRLNKGFGYFEAWRDKTLEQEKNELHKFERKIVRENHWLVHGVAGRRKRNRRRLLALEKLRQQRLEHRSTLGNVKMTSFESNLSGKIVIEAENIFKSFEHHPVVKGFSTRIMRGERLGIMGPNGVGKTTLLNLLAGKVLPDAGTVKIGKKVQKEFLDQKRNKLDPSETLEEALTSRGKESIVLNGRSRHVQSYMRDFLFLPEQAGTPVRELSGGERARLMLAQALARPSNLLVLDEPTNDLDLETLDLLQEMLSEYHGTILLVSHDRDFLDRIVTSLIVLDGDGQWTEYAGGYTDMLAQRKSEISSNSKIAKSRQKKTSSVRRKKRKSSAKLKLSYHEVYALEMLPGRISEVEEEIKQLRLELEVPNVFTADPNKFQETADRLRQAEISLSELEDEWLSLEILREDLER